MSSDPVRARVNQGSVRAVRKGPDANPDLEASYAAPETPAAAPAADANEPLCRLATNKDSKGVEGKWRLVAAIVLCTIFMVGEVIGGIFAHSLAVLTDAAHMLSDVSAFTISLCAGTYALRVSKASHTFGYHRAEVLGGLVSVAIIWVVTGILVYEAVLRIIHPENVNGKLMFIVAITGVAVNVINLFVLGGRGHNHNHGGHSHSHSQPHVENMPGNVAAEAGTQGVTQSNTADAHLEPTDGSGGRGSSHDGTTHNASTMSMGMRGAFIHVLGDCVQSFGVVIAAIIIWVKPEYHIADPICTFIFAIAVLWTTKSMLRDITDIIMERVPRGFDVAALGAALSSVPGVNSVHDLHVWALKPGVVVLAVHIDTSAESIPAAVLHGITACCRANGVQHSTVQLTSQGDVCPCNTTFV